MFTHNVSELKNYQDWIDVTGREAQTRQMAWEEKWRALKLNREEWWQKLNKSSEVEALKDVGTSLVKEVDVVSQSKQLGAPEQQNLPNIEEEQEADDDDEHAD